MNTLRLSDVRKVFRLVGEIRELGRDPNHWRPHMIRALAKLVNGQIVVSSEIHFRAVGKKPVYTVYDIGWGCDSDGNTWQIRTEREESPESYWVSVPKLSVKADTKPPGQVVAVKPAAPVYGGSCFILSQVPLPHVGAVDQLGVHRAFGEQPSFTHAEHRLLRLFHFELGRFWSRDALANASDPNRALPPRLSQTLDALAAGASEKQVSLQLGISRHTVHNYVKALHARMGVNSRGELLAKASQSKPSDFTPKLSLNPPGRPSASGK